MGVCPSTIRVPPHWRKTARARAAPSRPTKAQGKRPELRNLSAEMVECFRRTVAVVDRIGMTDLATLVDTVRRCAEQESALAPGFAHVEVVAPRRGYLPGRMVSDPAGYFVVYVDAHQQMLSLEHAVI